LATAGEFRIGRASDNDLVVNSGHVSSHHTRLIKTPHGLEIEDLGSTNHTYVDGYQVHRSSVSVGDSVQLSAHYELNWNDPRLQQWLRGGVQQAPKPVPYQSPGLQRNRPVPQYQANDAAQQPIQAEVLEQYPPQQSRPSGQGRSEGDVRLQHMEEMMDARHDQQMHAMARLESMTGKAWLTFFAYYFGFFIAGLIMNIVFLCKSNSVKKATGHHPPGHGCLVFLLFFHVLLPLLLLILIAAGGAGSM